MKLFDDTLKPKHHLLLHYPHAMEMMGPIRQMSCMRFEAKHKELKDVAKAITSRTNPAYSLSFKQQLSLNYRFILKKRLDDRLTWGVILHEKLSAIQLYEQFKKVLRPETSDDYKSTSWIEINGTMYKPNMVITVDNTDHKFGKIQYTLLHESRDVYFLYKAVMVVQLRKHFYAYEVEELASWGFISQRKLSMHRVEKIHYSPQGIRYIPVVP